MAAASVEPIRAKLVSRLPQGVTGRGDGRRSTVSHADRHPTNENYKTISGRVPARPLRRRGIDPAAPIGDSAVMDTDRSLGDADDFWLDRASIAAVVAQNVCTVDSASEAERDMLLSDLLCAAWPTPCSQRQ